MTRLASRVHTLEDDTFSKMTNFTLCTYQEERVKHATRKNTIVNLPARFGKTLFSTRLIDPFLHTTHAKS
jgi:ERCC4-related helicase